MSTDVPGEREAADWVAAHDQLRAEIMNILDRRLPFMICWIEEDENGDPEKVATTGLCRMGDDLQFLMAMLKRHQSEDGHVYASPRPGEDSYE